MQRKTYLFIYGTLRKEVKRPMHQVLARYGMLVGAGSFQGKLYDLGRYPGAVVSGKKSDRVYGEIYQLRDTGRVFEILDEYEGWLFTRQQAPVALDSGKKLTSWIYFYCGRVKGAARIHSGDYLTRLVNR